MVWGLVEERRPEGTRDRAEESRRESKQARIAGDLLDDRMAHQMPCAGTAPLESFLFERRGDIRGFVSIQNGGHDFEAVGDVIWPFDQRCIRLAIEGTVDTSCSQCIGVSP